MAQSPRARDMGWWERSREARIVLTTVGATILFFVWLAHQPDPQHVMDVLIGLPGVALMLCGAIAAVILVFAMLFGRRR